MKRTEDIKFDINRVKALCEAFYNGETDPQQEQLLLRYFENNDVPEELSDDKEIFLRIFKPEDVKLPDTIEGNLIDLIDRLAEKEAATKKKRLRFKIWAAAASVTILISAGVLVTNFSREDSITTEVKTPKDTYENPEKAYDEAQKALTLVSVNFNKGIDRLSLIDANIEKTNKILDKAIK